MPGVDPSRLEPESAPGPRPSGAGDAQKSGGTATLAIIKFVFKLQYKVLDKDEINASVFASSGYPHSFNADPDPAFFRNADSDYNFFKIRQK